VNCDPKDNYEMHQQLVYKSECSWLIDSKKT